MVFIQEITYQKLRVEHVTYAENLTYFDSFGVEHIPKETRKLIGNVYRTNIYRIQAYDSIMCRYVLLYLLVSC